MPAAAALVAVRLSVLDVLVLDDPKLAATPAGRPEALRATTPVKPFNPAIVTVLVALDPAVKERELAEGTRLKLGD